ncbi:MAG: hypothetical protein L0Y44_04155 [Phycisphaerales bacterium]|nr:hypothetical protein [Phycisphaerales bacterium]
MNKKTHRGPMRAWCLCVRASDRRINGYSADCELAPEAVIGRDESVEEAVARGVEHIVTLRGELIRKVTRQVLVPWPGEDWEKFAKKCGVTTYHLNSWIASGNVKIRRKFCAMAMGKRGKPVPIVYTPMPIDPNNYEGRPPHRVWGELWRCMSEKFPAEYEQQVQRVPRWQMRLGRRKFGGYRWICPGVTRSMGLRSSKSPALTPDPSPRGRGGGEVALHVPCGRECAMLYAPMPVWTLGRALGIGEGLDLPEDCGLGGDWRPGTYEVECGEGSRTLACKKCWGVRGASMVSDGGWNLFVTLVSGGLLYGRDVERPEKEAPTTRVRMHVAPNRKYRTKKVLERFGSSVDENEVERFRRAERVRRA